MDSSTQRPGEARLLRSRWFAIPIGVAVASVGAAVITLVVAGVILGGYLDAGGATSIPAMEWLSRLPAPLRIAIELVVGVPVAFGVAVYAISQLFEFLMFITWPVRKAVEAVQDRQG